jgi:hypothetical protein
MTVSLDREALHPILGHFLDQTANIKIRILLLIFLIERLLSSPLLK